MNEVCPVKENDYDNSVVDRAIHVWLDRGVDFRDNLFSENYKFIALKSENADIIKLRTYLMLDSDEWYVCLAQNILTSFTGVLRKVKNNVFSKNLHELPNKPNFKPRELSIVNDGNHYSYFKSYAGQFPIPTKFKIEGASVDMIKVMTDTGLSYNVAVKVTSTYGSPPEFLGYSIIRADWGEGFPFKGAFKYEGLWNVGMQVELDYFPPSIDYKNWISEVEGGVTIDNILNNTNLFENYSLAKEPLEKLAILYSSLILNYDSEIKLK